MEFMNRMVPPQQQPSRMTVPEPMEPRQTVKRHGKPDLITLGSGIATNAILFFGALLVAALVWFIFSSQPTNENRYVDTTHLQAVFLNNNQVYFGNITALNKDYMVLSNVYYLQTAGTGTTTTAKDANQNVSLVKLGCELHKPYDSMILNNAQVNFWENLQGDGQVAKAVDKYQQQNPNGQTCSNQPASSSQNLQNQGTTKP